MDEVARLLAGRRFLYASEDDLQRALASILENEGYEPRREVRLSRRDRIDLMVGRVGIEVKVAGKPEAVMRQLVRYSESPEVDALILVTARARHGWGDGEVGGKPVRVVSVLGAL